MLKNKLTKEKEDRVKELLIKKGLYNQNRNIEHHTQDITYNLLSLLKASSLKPLAINVFYKITKIYPSFFEPLEDAIIKSGMKVNPQVYVGSIFMFSTFISTILISILLGFYAAQSFPPLILLSGIILSLIFPLIIIGTLGYIYPFYLINEKRKNIKNNMPFMINHLYAISHASLPLDRTFKMIIEMGEYGELNKEIKRIVERIDSFGDDAIKAIRYVASTTPSDELKTLLFGILSVVESGGNLREYLSEKSQYALFTYSLERKKYVETLSTYADIYTAILIAAPLFLVAVLAVINIVPESKILGMEPIKIMKIGTYFLIPFINLLFLGFLSLTQPEI